MVSGTTPLSVTFPAAPAGLSHVSAIPELALGDAGRIVFPLPTLAPGSSTAQVLAPTGNLAGHYEVVALAQPSATSTTPFSSAFVHGVTGSATVPDWLAAPTVTGRREFSRFTGTGNLHTAQLVRANQTLWNVTILDGTTTFTLPTVTPDPLAAARSTSRSTTGDVASFDATKFDVPTVKQSLSRRLGERRRRSVH